MGRERARRPWSPARGFKVSSSRLVSKVLCMARRGLQVGNFIPSLLTIIRSG